MSRINKKDGNEKMTPGRYFTFGEFENNLPMEPARFKKPLKLPDYNFIVPWQLNEQLLNDRKVAW